MERVKAWGPALLSTIALIVLVWVGLSRDSRSNLSSRDASFSLDTLIPTSFLPAIQKMLLPTIEGYMEYVTICYSGSLAYLNCNDAVGPPDDRFWRADDFIDNRGQWNITQEATGGILLLYKRGGGILKITAYDRFLNEVHSKIYALDVQNEPGWVEIPIDAPFWFVGVAGNNGIPPSFDIDAIGWYND